MEIRRLIDALVRPGAYPHPVDHVDVLHTHISVVFLAGAFAYKVKKPLDLGFLDFTTFERRLHYCHEEVRLNRRLAPRVYLGVAPIVRTGEGELVVGDAGSEGDIVEHAVRMVRLPEGATLLHRLATAPGEVGAGVVRALARRVARFHAEAARGAEVSRHARWEAVAANARENLVQSRDRIGVTVSAPVHARLTVALERWLEELRPLIERRASEHVARDTHGDLHLDHVYLFPDREPPDDLVVIDCIEFSERFRCADPVSDMAFLAMDLVRQGHRRLEAEFSARYFEAAGDAEGPRLLPFYRAYRAAVRGKVDGLVGGDEVPENARARATARARGHWLLALSELEPPERRPGLVLVGGLPGTGKSTVARSLSDAFGLRLVSSDRTRKRLAGIDAGAGAAAPFGKGIYAPEWTRRTYEACLAEARDALFLGERVAVDATFSRESERRRFLEAARELGVRAVLLLCEADEHVVRERLRERGRESGSDADWTIHREMRERWEEVSAGVAGSVVRVSTSGPLHAALGDARRGLVDAGLARGGRVEGRGRAPRPERGGRG